MALAPPGPSEKRAEPDVSLLLRRTGFGPTGAEIEAATRRGYEATVEALLHPGTDPGATATPRSSCGSTGSATPDGRRTRTWPAS